jgi:hypothetical protein
MFVGNRNCYLSRKVKMSYYLEWGKHVSEALKATLWKIEGGGCSCHDHKWIDKY